MTFLFAWAPSLKLGLCWGLGVGFRFGGVFWVCIALTLLVLFFSGWGLFGVCFVGLFSWDFRWLLCVGT